MLAVSILTPVGFGLIPMLRASRTDLNEALREGGRSLAGGLSGRRRLSLLVAIEVALSLTLSISAGLMIKSFIRLQQVDPGFNVANLMTMRITLPRPRYSNNSAVASSYEGLLARISALPGVQSTCASSALPLGGGGHYLPRESLVEGDPEPPAGPEYFGNWNVVTPDYFATMGIPLLKGRAFTKADTADSPMVIIINEAMARQIFRDENPLGKRIRSWRDENKLREIIGVVADVCYLGRKDVARPLVYVPHRQDTWIAMVLTVRTATNPMTITDSIRNAIWSMDESLAIAHIETMEQVLADSISGPRFSLLLLSVFALLALILAVLGVYAVVSYSVAQRTHEIAIRLALGAQRRDIIRLVIGQGVIICLLGIGTGLISALFVTRVMSSLLFDVGATDLGTFAGAPLLLIAVVLAGSYFPARRAILVNPGIALRDE